MTSDEAGSVSHEAQFNAVFEDMKRQYELVLKRVANYQQIAAARYAYATWAIMAGMYAEANAARRQAAEYAYKARQIMRIEP